ncbi:hypothetical protein [Vagococcus acidifermentans]
MRFRYVVIGLAGIAGITFICSWVLFHRLFKRKWPSKTALFGMTIILLGSLAMTGYTGYLYAGIKWRGQRPAQLVKIDGKTIETYANAKERLMLVSPYNTIEHTHPSVVNFPKKWHGYKYWLATTAYPKGDAYKENPHIYASSDLLSWKPAAENPLDEPRHPQRGKDGKVIQYNSDTHLLYNDEKDRLELFWRYVDDVNNEVTIFRKTSTDGKSWSDNEIAYRANRRGADMVSPAFIKDDQGYKVWYVANGYKIWYRDSKEGTAWSEPQEITVPYHETDMRHWHIDVQKFDGKYEMLVVGFKDLPDVNSPQERHTMNVYHSVSDDGKSWSTLEPVIYPSQVKGQWDGKGLYRSSFMKEHDTYYVFYSGIGFDDTRGIGLSYGKDIRRLKGIDYSDYKDLYN